MHTRVACQLPKYPVTAHYHEKVAFLFLVPSKISVYLCFSKLELSPKTISKSTILSYHLVKRAQIRLRKCSLILALLTHAHDHSRIQLILLLYLLYEERLCIKSIIYFIYFSYQNKDLYFTAIDFWLKSDRTIIVRIEMRPG